MPIASNRFADYVVALREVSAQVAAEGRPLYEVLRESTGIYQRWLLSPFHQCRLCSMRPYPNLPRSCCAW